MPDALEVHLNRDGPHSIEVATPSLETEGDFDVVLRNHGAALHVHLNLDSTLSRAASITTANHYVEEGSIRRVRVEVDQAGPRVEGRLKVVTGYGAETEFVSVRLVEPGETVSRVRVSEELGKPQPREEGPIIDPERLPTVALGIVAALVAVLAVALIDDPVVALGVLVVMVGVGIAGALLVR